MKLLLTSAGITNQSILQSLDELAGKPLDQLKVAFIPTAANLESGDKDWLIDDLRRLSFLKFNQIDIVDISALPKNIWQKRLEEADILFVEGGNTYYLMHWVNKSGLSKILPKLLETRIYIGVSAGTIITTPSIINADFEVKPLKEIHEEVFHDGLSLVDFMVEPHVNSEYFPESSLENLETRSQKYQYPIYGIDDATAIKVDGDNIEVISNGIWKKFEK